MRMINRHRIGYNDQANDAYILSKAQADRSVII